MMSSSIGRLKDLAAMESNLGGHVAAQRHLRMKLIRKGGAITLGPKVLFHGSKGVLSLGLMSQPSQKILFQAAALRINRRIYFLYCISASKRVTPGSMLSGFAISDSTTVL